MFFVSQNLTDQLSMEAFYQLSWKQTVVDNCGTFFSSADVAADGCDNNYSILNRQLTQNVIKPNGGAALNAMGGVQFSDEVDGSAWQG